MATQPHNRLRVLFVDDERSLQEFMRTELPRLGHDVVVCPNGTTALQAIAQQTFDAAILDVRMPDISGIEVLQRLKLVSPDTEAVMMTGYASEESAVQAMRLGACDYLRKPCKLSEIEAVLLRMQDKKRLKNKAAALETRVQAAEGPGLLIGSSAAMMPVQRQVDQFAPTDARMLITGETGTGKEVVARTLYLKSKRADMPFVPVNCGALSSNLVESQLFGHRKGSFTGADKDHKGFFEVANGGTVFLDELGELDMNVQVKLLRFLETGEIQRLGDNQPFIVDVRVICATNRDLRQMVGERTFREDLLFRLNKFPIHIPPLRERREDIPELALHLLARYAKRPAELVVDLLTTESLEVLMNCYWQGNVRELANAMEYAWIVSAGQPITTQHLPYEVRAPRPAAGPALHQPYAPPRATEPVVLPMSGQGGAVAYPTAGAAGTKTLSDVEMDYILQVYAKNNQNKQATSAELGISLKTLYNKLHKYEEERQHRAG
ncbi:sigma-54-dependent transcriptional regulator [Fimbriiglobus ruber]|uniref:Response regulator of zinc sigma-54-dependent two-component system n=1 Tax=Fimbriiglobus ruber TaxID=1908690 RepID=A0A225DXJ3_9BACT|nr:sigma-54 dependent transcriptional regulator [Fimbriiglobus ruber]OWK44304.1 Response regulator of zinc sigma-54-dependent two-component system [Fimbriiglobus ruber]